MSDPKILNLDEFRGDEKTVVLNGVSYPVRDMTVEEYINHEEPPADADDKIKAAFMVKQLCIFVAGAPEEELRKLPFFKIKALMDFVTAKEAAEASGN